MALRFLTWGILFVSVFVLPCRHIVDFNNLQVAEVRSRFEAEEGGVERFLEVTKRLGFDCRQMDRTNKMFLLAEFKKSAREPEKGVDFEAKVR